MMILVIILLNSAVAEYLHNCPSVFNKITFQRSSDDQYSLKWCSDTSSIDHGWKREINYYYPSNMRSATCNGSKYIDYLDQYHIHSIYDDPIETLPQADCNHVCYMQEIDLIGNGCFYIKIYDKHEGKEQLYAQSYYYVSNTTHQSIDDFKNRRSIVNVETTGNIMSVDWQFSGIPVSDDYTFLISKNSSEESPEEYTENCTVQLKRQGIKCLLQLPSGCYRLIFKNPVPYTFLDGYQQHHSLKCHNVSEGLDASASAVGGGVGAGAWWAAGALLALALLVAGALLLWRRRLAAEDGKRIAEAWRTYWIKDVGAPYSEEEGLQQRRVEGGEGACSVLLLYARDCEPAAERAVTALKQLLQHAVTGQVYDLFSPECACAWSVSPREWVSALVRRDDVRVVLLHTPAAALYEARLTDEHQLESGVMGRAVAYSDPQYGDALVAFALQLVRAAAAESSDPFCHPHHSHSHYRKYFIAHVSGLTGEYAGAGWDVELARGVAPYTRYLLPDAAPLLLRDVAAERGCTGRASPPAPPPVPSHLLVELESALGELTAHAHRRPDYLTDHLHFLHTAA